MDELELQEKPGLFSRLSGLFGRSDIEEEENFDTETPAPTTTYQLRHAHRYHVTIRREIRSFDDAYSAANGLRRGEQQILNLVSTEPILRQKIVDFMAGVAFAQDANWEEIGECIYLVAPSNAFVEMAPYGELVQPQRVSGTFFSN